MLSASTAGRVTPLAEHRGGHDDGSVPVVFYGDYTRPASRAAFAALKQVESLADGDVTVVHRHLVSDPGSWAHRLAEAAEAAATLGSFLAMHDGLYVRSPRSEEEVLAVATTAGLDVATFEARWRRPDGSSAVLAQHDALAGLDRVRHAPTVLLGGAPSSSPTDPKVLWAEVRSAIGHTWVRTGAA